jgi:hypothetical protein
LNEEEAIKSVSDELKKPDSALMVFKPVDVEASFFVGETLIVAAASLLINAFGKGVKAALEKRVEDLGKKITNWFMDKIEDLFRDEVKDSEVEKEKLNLKKSIEQLKNEVKKADKKQLTNAIELSENNMVSILKDNGLTDARAKEIAKIIRNETEKLIRS